MKTLPDAIESILCQDYPHELMQVVFVDDGSDDETLSVIKSYVPKMDVKVEVFHHKWRGLGYTRNVVVANAEGDFILWVDGDMAFSKDFMSKLVKFIEQHPKSGIVKGNLSLESGENLLATLETYSRAANIMRDYASEKAQFKAFGTGGAIYRVEAINQVGGFNDRISGYGEDFDIEYRIRKAGWLLSPTDVQFRDYERGKVSWKDLWCKYIKRGYDSYRFTRERKRHLNVYAMLPPGAFLAGLFNSFKIYKKINKKVAFLLPLQYVFKLSAWCVGFIKASSNSKRVSVKAK